jgi:ketosteroid isomerase-like protein
MPASDLATPDAIHQQHLGFIAALNRGEVDAAFALLTDDFLALVERQPTMDKSTFRAALGGFLAAFNAHFEFDVDEIIDAGAWAFERVRYRDTHSPKSGGSPSSVTWRAVVLWQRDPAGAWRIARYIRTPDPEPTP